MTHKLLETYKSIKKLSKQNENISNDTNLMKLILSEKPLNERYKPLKIIGKGVFGIVIKAFDTRENKNVAIKIMKNHNQAKEQAKREVKMLQFINKIDHDKGFIVRL